MVAASSGAHGQPPPVGGGALRVVVFLVVFGLLVGGAYLILGSGPGQKDVKELVESRLRQGDVAGARAELRDSVGDMEPGLADYLEGLLFLAEGRQDDALAPLERAWEALPDDPDVMDAYRSLLARRGDSGTERAVVEDFLTRHPDEERALFAAAVVWLGPTAREEDPGRAWEYMERLAYLREERGVPEGAGAIAEAQIRMARAKAAVSAGRTNVGLADARHLAELQPRSADVILLLAEAAREAGELVESRDAYIRAIGLLPGDPRPVEDLVKLLLIEDAPRAEVVQEMLSWTGRLNDRWPDRDSGWILRARALVRAAELKGDAPDEALAIYRRLAEKDPPNREAARNAALICYDWKVGGQESQYLDEAHRLLQLYLKLGGVLDDPALQDVWRRLEERERRGGDRDD